METVRIQVKNSPVFVLSFFMKGEASQEYSMALYYHVTGEQRKALVTAVSAFADAPAVYQNAPTFAYAIGEYSVDKEGTLTGPASEALVAALQAKGFMAE